MEGEEERSDAEGSFSKTSIPKRIAIVAAGGSVNIIFGLVTYFILVSASGGYISNVVDTVNNQTGIYAGDKIIAINDKTVHLNSDIQEELQNSNGNIVKLLLERDGERKVVEVQPQTSQTRVIGIYFGSQEEAKSTQISYIYPDSPAEEAGLEEKDIIIAIDGKEVGTDPYKVIEYLNENQNEKVTLTIQRKEEEKQIEVIPQTTTSYLLGVTFAVAPNTFGGNITYGFWDTVDFSVSIIDNLKMLFTGNVRADQLMGPIGISGMVAETSGIYDFIYLLALISLSLGITNLLPFPPLDGGKILIYIIEAIRRKPLKENVEMGLQTAGFAIMILLSLYVAYNDVLRIF